MSDAKKSPQKRIHPFKISDLHDIYVGGNPAVWNTAINKLREFLLSGIALKPTEHQNFALQHLLVDDPITTVEQFNKLIGGLESVWVAAPVEDSSPEKKARSQKLAGIQPDAKSKDKDDSPTNARREKLRRLTKNLRKTNPKLADAIEKFCGEMKSYYEVDTEFRDLLKLFPGNSFSDVSIKMAKAAGLKE